MFNEEITTYQVLNANTYNQHTIYTSLHKITSIYSNYQHMRLMCPYIDNRCKTDEIPNPLNIPCNIYVSWLQVDKWDQLNMSYAMWTMGFTLAMVDHNYHIYPNSWLSSKEYIRWDVILNTFWMTHVEYTCLLKINVPNQISVSEPFVLQLHYLIVLFS